MLPQHQNLFIVYLPSCDGDYLANHYSSIVAPLTYAQLMTCMHTFTHKESVKQTKQTSTRSAFPSRTLCSCLSCWWIVFSRNGPFGPRTTATSTPPVCYQQWKESSRQQRSETSTQNAEISLWFFWILIFLLGDQNWWKEEAHSKSWYFHIQIIRENTSLCCKNG